MFVFFLVQVVGMVRLENLMVNQSVALKRITKRANRFVHQKTMQRPFEKRGETRAQDKTEGGPKQECGHLFLGYRNSLAKSEGNSRLGEIVR